MPKNNRRRNEDKSDSKLGTFIIILLFVLIWLTALTLLVKFDAGGLGTTLRPYIKDIPVLNLILPAVPDEQVQYENNYPYKNMSEAIEAIRQLTEENTALKLENEEHEKTIAELQAENSRLQVFEDNVEAFEERVRRFDQYVVFNDKAPDVEEYKQFYESIDPENAERLYQYVLELMQYDEGIKTQAKLFAEMKPGQAADTLQEMTADIEWIVKVMLSMKTSNATEIMNKMEPLYVARIMQRMSDLNEAKLQSLYQVLNTEYPE